MKINPFLKKYLDPELRNKFIHKKYLKPEWGSQIQFST